MAGTQMEGFPDTRGVSPAEGRAGSVCWQLWGLSRRLGQALGRAGLVRGEAGPWAEVDRAVLVTSGPLL